MSIELPTRTGLFSEFAPASPDDWRKAAEESLEGVSIEKKLVTRTPEGIDLRPIYTREDLERVTQDGSHVSLIDRAEALSRRPVNGWHLCQEPNTGDPAAFNAALLRDLKGGQNAVSLPLAYAGVAPLEGELELNTMADWETVLRDVDLSAVPLFVHVGSAGLPAANTLVALLARRGLPAKALSGAILADPIVEFVKTGALPVTVPYAFDDMVRLHHLAKKDGLEIRTVGVDTTIWAEAGGNAVQELAFGLASGVEYLRALEQRGVSVNEAAPRFLFTYGIGSHLFMEISKLRAARLLWARAVQVAGGNAAAQQMVIHGRTVSWNKTLLDPHVNLLRSTTEAFAGVIGGCDGLTVTAFDGCYREADDFSRRLARNIQIILDEECQFGRVADPAGGSYYVETLTAQLAEKAWALFQEIERRGGLVASLRAGFPQSLVEKTANERLSAVTTRRDGIIGSSLHPNLKETIQSGFHPAPARVVVGKENITRVVARRRAEPFERLRSRTDTFLAKTGARPKVFLAGFGPRKQHAARADFSSGFFAAGGFEAITNKGFPTPAEAAEAALKSGAPVVVLCSTDDTYPELVPPCAKGLKSVAKPPLVILAGLPASPELQQQFKNAGVDDFIHLRADCARMLSGFLDVIGI